jgi:hypothetical protein
MADNAETRNNEFDADARSRRKASGNGALIAMISLGLLLVGGMIFALVYFLSGSSGNLDSEMLAFLPADSNMISGLDADELLQNKKIKELLDKVPEKSDKSPLTELNEKLKPTGLTIDDFSRILMGQEMAKGQPTFVFRTKKSFDKAKMAEYFGARQEQKKGDKTYYTSRWGDVVYFPSDTLIVETTEKHFETLSSKDPGKVLVSDEALRDLAKKMSKGHVWAVMSRGALDDKEMKGVEGVKQLKLPYLVPDLLDAVKDMKTAGFWTKLDGDNVKSGGVLICGNKDLADKAEKALKKEIDDRRDKSLENDPTIGVLFRQFPDDMKSLVGNFQKSLAVDRSGAALEISGTFNVSGVDMIRNYFVVKQRAEMTERMRQEEIREKEFRDKNEIDVKRTQPKQEKIESAPDGNDPVKQPREAPK